MFPCAGTLSRIPGISSRHRDAQPVSLKVFHEVGAFEPLAHTHTWPSGFELVVPCVLLRHVAKDHRCRQFRENFSCFQTVLLHSNLRSQEANTDYAVAIVTSSLTCLHSPHCPNHSVGNLTQFNGLNKTKHYFESEKELESSGKNQRLLELTTKPQSPLRGVFQIGS